MIQDDSAIPNPDVSNADHDVECQLDGLERQFTELREQVKQLQRLASLGTLSAVLAHEFNNRLAPIVSYSQYALQRGDPELTRSALEKTFAASQRLAELCSKILGMASDDDAGPADAPLAPIVSEAVDCLARDLAKDDIVLTVDVAPDLKARFRPPTLQQVLFNLLLNARQAMLGRPGRLSVSARQTGERVEIAVADTGPGIKPENLEKIFEPFFSTKRHQTSLERGGVGLGLYVCKQLMTELSGTITVASKPGQGATFTLTLPAAL